MQWSGRPGSPADKFDPSVTSLSPDCLSFPQHAPPDEGQRMSRLEHFIATSRTPGHARVPPLIPAPFNSFYLHCRGARQRSMKSRVNQDEKDNLQALAESLQTLRQSITEADEGSTWYCVSERENRLRVASVTVSSHVSPRMPAKGWWGRR